MTGRDQMRYRYVGNLSIVFLMQWVLQCMSPEGRNVGHRQRTTELLTLYDNYLNYAIAYIVILTA